LYDSYLIFGDPLAEPQIGCRFKSIGCGGSTSLKLDRRSDEQVKHADIYCLCLPSNIETGVAIACEFNRVASGDPKRGVLILVIELAIRDYS
jgi:hypothetical protein